MSVSWDDIQKAIHPIKNYEELCKRWQVSFSYAVVRENFNFSIPDITGYAQRLLGGDSRGRYTGYVKPLTAIFTELGDAGIENLQDLKNQVDTRNKLESFSAQKGIAAPKIASVLKFLIYWFIPSPKLMSGLVEKSPAMGEAISALRRMDMRTNLDMLQHGITASDWRALAETSGLPETVIAELVNRADLSRMPWASRATISNITGAGYGSISRLANADPVKLFEDFFTYGILIGKNLKLGNEIENSYRMAKIVPILVKDE